MSKWFKYMYMYAKLLNFYNPVQRVETLRLLKRIFRSQTSLFSFTPLPHFNVVVATKSIGQSNIHVLNIEKGEGRINRMQCNFIENEGNPQIIANFLCVSTILHGMVILVH